MVLTIFGVFSLQVNKDEKVTQAQVEHKSSEIKIRAANMVRVIGSNFTHSAYKVSIVEYP